VGRRASPTWPAARATTKQGQPRRLMVVESDMKMQDKLREVFKRNGYRVLVSSDPHRVLNRFLRSRRPPTLFC